MLLLLLVHLLGIFLFPGKRAGRLPNVHLPEQFGRRVDVYRAELRTRRWLASVFIFAFVAVAVSISVSASISVSVSVSGEPRGAESVGVCEAVDNGCLARATHTRNHNFH